MSETGEGGSKRVSQRVAQPQIPSPAEATRQIVEAASAPPQQVEEEVDWRDTVSTGSLLLDLAISGLKTRYGGLPGGVLVEIFGDSGTGKTTILGEIAGSVQRRGGEVRFKDPEARLDPDYCKLMGIRYNPDDFSYPNTITEVEESIIGPLVIKDKKTVRLHDKAWRPKPEQIHCEADDSLSALCSRMEVEQGDKMGQRRALDFSIMFRMIARHIKKHNILMVCSNQIRDNIDPTGKGWGPKTRTSGGHAIKFYSSVRIELRLVGRLKKDKHPIGKQIEAFIFKNSLDIEWRVAPIRILFGYGIDDIGANLQWLKDNDGFTHPTDPSKTPGYVVGGKNFQALDNAIAHVEQNNLEQVIRDQVADLWYKMEMAARPQRKEKVRP